MPTVLLVRHGQASFGAEDYDVLSPAGRRQSELLAESLHRRGVEPSRMVSGTLRRQTETAAAFAEFGEPRIDERWNEYDANGILTHHGATETRIDGPAVEAQAQGGMTTKSFQAILEGALDTWIAADGAAAPCQSWADFAGGAGDAMAELAADLGRGETGIAFTSGGTIAAICAALLGAAGPTFVALNRTAVNTGVTKIAIGSTGASLVSVNDHAHLELVDRALVTYR